MSHPTSRAPGLVASVAIALAAACATFAFAALLLWRSGARTLAALDFNAALFEDFLGPYWATAHNLLTASQEPAAGYLYPSTLAWLLAPIAWLGAWLDARLGGGSMAASWAAVAFVLGSLAVLIASVFSMLRPQSLWIAAAAGAVFGLAHAPIHGGYWAQASLPAIAGLAAGLALFQKDRPVLGGAAIGFAGALKLHPLIGVVALVVPRRGSGRSTVGAVTAAISWCLFTVGLPWVAMGSDAFLRFHRAVFERLGAMNAWVMTKEGGRGSQDLPAILGRAVPLDSHLARKAVGWTIGVFLVWLAVRALRSRESGTPRMLAAFVFLAAVPWAAVSPTWPHGLLWVPAAWWIAANSSSRVSGWLAAASFAAGSIVALRALGTPEAYAWYGLPAWSAFLAVASAAAAVFDRSLAPRD
ncbi:glycosyltransferase 87 family protein [Planctomycetes bacterium Poly30]|uniref:glycosyltransferase 87 family protein n=1 Tax=Saltatorellus ferox TaxID=2528018 RepID=UPI0011A4D12B